ncbi:hypothetical protein ROZALSC1DRAFT_31952 [Rozella allomycis CSF55]|uniref:Uncharacterized protein n=1 Tax=Rozella allomycis (strain CSF55) TaxID=988480 RepID=A0A075ANF4_ROZAC|nr:hypothetical protein O9G_006211 [Rozella allomycis CSF55]RKP15829.1 hypothetical protein ROZALSC1DRAFT_31952 [Rozella allomycis CSF55]|eukprot:EPZ31367.1 hypothetical protein O9G_006211 [Rozella allomycis CSF55]
MTFTPVSPEKVPEKVLDNLEMEDAVFDDNENFEHELSNVYADDEDYFYHEIHDGIFHESEYGTQFSELGHGEQWTQNEEDKEFSLPKPVDLVLSYPKFKKSRFEDY